MAPLSRSGLSVIFLISLVLPYDSDSLFSIMDTMKVNSESTLRNESIDLEVLQKQFGLTDDINKLLFLKPGIERVPEAGSAFLIKGSGLYETRYKVMGVPMLNPSHFSLHSYADRNGVMISTMKKANIITNGTGRYTDASGGMILLEPQILRYSRNNRAWELIGSTGSIDQEILLSAPFGKKKNFYQIGGRFTNGYQINHKNHAWGNGNTPMSAFVSSDSARLNYSAPNMFGDLHLITNHDFKAFHLKTFTWYAIDTYEECWREERKVNWGLFSAKLKSKKSDSRLSEMTFGGSRQLFFEGKRYGLVTPLKEIKRENVVLSGKLNPCNIGNFNFKSDFSIEAVKWNGFLSLYYDSSISDSHKVHRNPLTNTNKMLETSSNDITGSAHVSLLKNTSKKTFGVNLLAGIAGPYNTHVFVDPSFFYIYRNNKTALTANIGSMTFYPDIRGLPEKDYINKKLKTYSANSEFELSLWRKKLHLYAETYIKYSPNHPKFSEKAGYIVWDPDCQSKLLSYGVCFSSKLDGERFGFYTFQNFGRSRRHYNNKTVPFEWEIPWSNKTTLRYNLSSGKLNLYFICIFAGGIPYREIVLKNDGVLSYDNNYKRVKTYKRLDMKIETINKVDHKFITQFNAYLDIINIANAFEGLFKPSKWVWENEREYFWDGNLKKHPVQVEKASVALGIKLGFKRF